MIRINDRAFSGCESLTEIEIPDGVTKMSLNMCYDCTSLKEVVVPAFVTEMDNYVFEKCTNLEKVVIPAGVRKIGFCVFRDCENVTVYCKGAKKAKDWHEHWDEVKSGNLFTRKRAKVIWNYKG